MKFQKIALLLITSVVLHACGNNEPITPEHTDPVVKEDPQVVVEPTVPTPAFNADSAFAFVQQQVDFGPRVPNSDAHKTCAEFLKKKLESYGAKLVVQTGIVTAWDKKELHIQNIIGRFKPDAPKRIMLCAHWDTRPFADKDTKDKMKPIDGANDGASGVGVLLEVARVLSENDHKTGVDIIFFDAEDYGELQSDPNSMIDLSTSMSDTWCLGSQYWARNPPIANYKPEFGILLDMVGGQDAVFPKEGVSMQHANHVVQSVWKKAQNLGYGQYFINYAIGGLIDDHTYINKMTGIPTIDIIHYEPSTGGFGSFHHTHNDNMSIIDKNTLKAVGQTLSEVIYQGL